MCNLNAIGTLKSAVTVGALALTAYSMIAYPTEVHELAIRVLTSAPVVGATGGFVAGGLAGLSFLLLPISQNVDVKEMIVLQACIMAGVGTFCGALLYPVFHHTSVADV